MYLCHIIFDVDISPFFGQNSLHGIFGSGAADHDNETDKASNNVKPTFHQNGSPLAWG